MLEHLVADYGYPAVLLGTFLEGETIVVLGAVAARRGLLDLELVIACSFCGSLLGDQLFFLLGRRYGRSFLAKHPKWDVRMLRARHMLERHQTPVILGFRFLYGLRNVIPFALGMSSVSLLRYVVLNVVGAAIWAVTLGCAGWALGAALETLLRDIAHAQAFVLAGLVAIAVFVFVARRVGRAEDAALEEEARHDAGAHVDDGPDAPGD
ncbi:MAG: DedA family protein [Planctomycetes bacterium]|nr:DedA family protein [Planctomycetota bacterium]